MCPGVKNNYALLLKDRDDKSRFDHQKAKLKKLKLGQSTGRVFWTAVRAQKWFMWDGRCVLLCHVVLCYVILCNADVYVHLHVHLHLTFMSCHVMSCYALYMYIDAERERHTYAYICIYPWDHTIYILDKQMTHLRVSDWYIWPIPRPARPARRRRSNSTAKRGLEAAPSWVGRLRAAARCWQLGLGSQFLWIVSG